MSPECAWYVHDCGRMLERVPTAALERARSKTEGRRARILAAVLRERSGEGRLTLDLHAAGDGLVATLTDWMGKVRYSGRLACQPTAEQLEPIVERVRDVEAPQIELAGELANATRYRVQRLFFDAGFRGEVIDGGSTIRGAEPSSSRAT